MARGFVCLPLADLARALRLTDETRVLAVHPWPERDAVRLVIEHPEIPPPPPHGALYMVDLDMILREEST